ncbi:MAG: MMPL family transporter [Bacteroidota bacterium]
MKKFADFTSQNPKMVLVFVAIVTVLLGLGIPKLETHNNQESELPEDDPIVLTNNRLDEVFGKKDILLVGIKSEDVYEQATLDKIMKITEELKEVEGVVADEIVSLTNINSISGEEWGLEVGPMIEEVPETESEIYALKQKVRDNRLVHKRLVSEDETFTTIMANVLIGSDQGLIHQQANAIAAKYEGPEEIYVAGGPVQSQEIDLGIQKDVNTLLPLALGLVLIGYLLSFGTWQGVVLPFGVVVLSIVWVMGAMGHIGYPITVVSSALPMLMVAIASSYGIHILQRYYEERWAFDHPRVAIAEAMKNIGPAVVMTGVTSALGSITLLIFKVTSIREFGVVTSIGILGILIISMTFLPAMIALLKPTKKKVEDCKLEGFLTNLALFSLRRRSQILLATGLILVISMIGISKIRIGNDFIKYFPKDHHLRVTFDQFNDNLGGTRSMEVMIEGLEEGDIKDPVLLKKIADFQEFAEQQAGVGYTSSFADVIRRIHREMNGGDPAFEIVPDSRELIAQYLLLYSMSGDPGDFNDLVDYDYQRAKIRVMLSTSEQDDHTRLFESFSAYGADLFGQTARLDFGGEIMFWLAQIRYIVTGKIQNIILAILVVLIFCIMVFRCFLQGFLAIIPLTLSTIMTFGVMGFLGIRLETGTAIITAIGIGIGVDFAIHYLSRYREEIRKSNNIEQATINTMVTSGRAILYDVFSNILGFIVFVFSGFIPLQAFGWLISLTMITVAFGSLVIFPLLFSLFPSTFQAKDKPVETALEMAEAR